MENEVRKSGFMAADVQRLAHELPKQYPDSVKWYSWCENAQEICDAFLAAEKKAEKCKGGRKRRK